MAFFAASLSKLINQLYSIKISSKENGIDSSFLLKFSIDFNDVLVFPMMPLSSHHGFYFFCVSGACFMLTALFDFYYKANSEAKGKLQIGLKSIMRTDRSVSE